jgi:aminoglycoside phosphotransferase (APT) family kinase protein
VEWRLGLLDRTWEEDAFEAHPAVTLARQWLWDNRPAVDRVSLLHGDYRNGNFMFDEDTGLFTAVLDWEMAHLGDRHYDLAYSMLRGYGIVADDGRYLCSGLIEVEDYIARYERDSGLAVDRSRLHYYTVLNLYWAVVACSASAPRIAHEQMTHLDVMMNFVAGLGFHFLGELTRILAEG